MRNRRGRVGAGVYDDVGRDARDQRRQRTGVGEIGDEAGAAVGERAGARRDDQFAEWRETATQLVADLAGGAEQQDLHGR